MKTSVIIALVVAFALFSIGGTYLATKGSSNSAATTPTTTPTTTATSSAKVTPMPSMAPTPTAPADAVSAHQVKLSTTMGDITLNLYPADAPLAVTNFVTLGKRGYYNGTIFHRVIKGFMNQGGDPTGTGSGGESIYGKIFKTEITKHSFIAGSLGAARTNAMDTNGSQFFINAAEYPSLDGQYTQFGQTADESSLAVVKAINSVPTGASDKPTADIKVTGFEITQA